MTMSVLRGLAVAFLALPALTATPAPAAPTSGAPAAVLAPEPHRLSLADAVGRLPDAVEAREGYVRTAFKHWVDADRDGCTTRAEVLIDESRTKPVIEAKCKVTRGTWYSYYDGTTLTDPKGLDIDHMVPLAEAWDSGASQWSPKRREAYANDLNAERSLVAVTAKSNRSKADQDPAQWLPPLADARCTYAADWTATKLRWALSADRAERAALTDLARGCGHQDVEYVPAAGQDTSSA
ncbi:HNH endonuclease family protein [Streptomyces sp. NPDC006552]|uniref:HNH endonuclease family protein n=1 Tax=Streptomyces sp. NPDC006552 TaxID=3157179 RepID=UPI00339F6D44